MSQPEQFDHNENSGVQLQPISDTYTSESADDIYHTPDVHSSADYEGEDVHDEAVVPSTTEASNAQGAMQDTHGLFSGTEPGNVNSDPAQQVNTGGYQYQNPYQVQQGDPAYGQQYTNIQPYGGQYGNHPYANGQYRNGAYSSGQYNNTGYGNGQYGNHTYDGTRYNNTNYGNGNFGNYHNGQYTNPPYGNAPYHANPYSPYATPQKKSYTGLIVGIVIAMIVLFLAAIFALAYKAVNMVTEERKVNSHINSDDYDFDYDYRNNYDHEYDYDYDHEYDHGYGYDYDHEYDHGYDYDYDYDGEYDYDSDEYYTLHDDLKYNLSYSVDFNYYDYVDEDNENATIMVTYPVIEGKNIPNLEKINEALAAEAEYITDYYEEEYKGVIGDGYFEAYSAGYVTYMDEEKMSVVFSENVSNGYYSSVYLYCVNIDMENGVVLDNEQMLSLDDAFSVDFRQKSDVQNGEISYLTSMSDQEITGYFNSSDIIVFYTPQGMEIGFNYENGWVTVTYDEYQKYLKVF